MVRKMNINRAILGLSFVFLYSIAEGQEARNPSLESDPIFHHDLKVFLDPKSRQISVEDVITLPENLAKNVVQFSLNSDLTITDASHEYSILENFSSNSYGESNAAGASIVNASTYSLKGNDRTRQIKINYSGSIYDLAEQNSEEYAQKKVLQQ